MDLFSRSNVLSRRVSAPAALLVGTVLITASVVGRAQAAPPMKSSGKTWAGNIYQPMPIFPYVAVFTVQDPNKPIDVKTPGLMEQWYVLPFAPWTIDCKYWHPDMGWFYRGDHIAGLADGYYETGYLATILANELKVSDVDEICYPGGDAGATWGIPGKPDNPG